ncbi:HEAT repeat-containing protein [Acrasis kona]|uniref:HEAT repeat-containing protein n=1 Tax=Acrasis kona TaxID=1008807 RepID=A0AAW2ZEA4_9EUKA
MSKEIVSFLTVYHKARVTFAQTAAELVKQPRNIEALIQKEPGILELLRPLLLDIESSVQQNAAKALGYIAGYSEQLAERVVSAEILPQLVYSLHNDNKQYKKSAAFVLRNVAKHNSILANQVVLADAIEPLVECLEQFDPAVKESAALSLSNIAKHDESLAIAVVHADAIRLLLNCVDEPEIPLKIAALTALSNISKHTGQLAQMIVDSEGISNIAPLITHNKVKKYACLCLSNIAKHSESLAEIVVEGEIFPMIFPLLADPEDPIVRRNAATLIREIAKRSPELSALVSNAGGLPAIVNYVDSAEDDSKLPGIMCLGFISAMTETLAASVIKAKAIAPLGDTLSDPNSSDHVKSAAVWALGQIGQHTTDHSRSVADLLPNLMDCYLSPRSSDDLVVKSENAMIFIIQKCIHLPALAPLLHEQAPLKILKHVVAQYAKVLPNDQDARRKFAETKGLAKLQIIHTDDDELRESIQSINGCYPDEVVKFYSPNWDKEILNRIEDESA